VGVCEIWGILVVFGWYERGELVAVCGVLRGDFVVRKTRQERPKAKALGYLEAKTATTTAKATAIGFLVEKDRAVVVG
jgi:hypothetical protein